MAVGQDTPPSHSLPDYTKVNDKTLESQRAKETRIWTRSRGLFCWSYSLMELERTTSGYCFDSSKLWGTLIHRCL